MGRTVPPLIGIVVIVLTLAADAWPADVGNIEPRAPGPGDVCPVCGMVVSLHAEWVAQIVLDDGSALFFDGSKDLFEYLLARERFVPDRQGSTIRATFVTSYYDVRAIPARTAFFVVGSDVLGPMGAELVPHPSRTAAEEFLRDHGGRAIVRFDEVTRELLESLE